MDPHGMSEEDQLTFAMSESMKSFASEEANQTKPDPPAYYSSHPGDTDEDDDLTKAIRESMKDQGGPGHYPQPNTNSVWGWPSSPNSPPPLHTDDYQYYPQPKGSVLPGCFHLDTSQSGTHTPGTGQTDRELRLVLLGMTGVGKSSTANMIIGRNHFKADCDGSSITFKCDHTTTKIEGREVLVIDTPGLFDTRQGNDDTMREITRCVCLSAPGPHALVLVVQGGNRQTEQVQKCAEIIMDVFGDQARRYMIVLFTHRDDLDHHGKSLVDFTNTLPDKMKRVLSLCGNRYLAFDNRARSVAEKQAQVKGLLVTIDKMVVRNGGRCFTNDVYKDFEKMIVVKERKLKEDLKRKQDEEERIFKARVEKVTQQKLAIVEENARKQTRISEERERKQERAYQREREQEKERELERERNAWKKQSEDLERERREQRHREEDRERQRVDQQRQDASRHAQEQQANETEQKRIRAEMNAKMKRQAEQAEADRKRREAQLRTEVRQEVQKDSGKSGGIISSAIKGVWGVGKAVVGGTWGIIKSIF